MAREPEGALERAGSARQRGIRHTVHIGSCETVHPKGLFFTAEVRRPGGNVYALNKRLQEEMCRSFYDAHALPIIVLRPGLHRGQPPRASAAIARSSGPGGTPPATAGSAATTRAGTRGLRCSREALRWRLPADSPYEEWALGERDRLRLLYTEAANHLGDLLLDRGAIEPALQLSQRLIRRDPCDEDAHRRAMRCFAATGRRTLVVRQYRTCVDTLARVLALGPSRETAHLYASLISD